MVRVEDPLGFLIDFFDSAEHPERPQQRYDLRRGAEVARLDHFNICVPDVPRAYEYYSGLGFGMSETIEDGQTLYAAWMYRKQTDTSDYYTGDPDHPVLRWSVLDLRRRDFCGNPVIPSWYSDASAVLDLDGKVRPVVEMAQTAEVTVGADGFTAPPSE